MTFPTIFDWLERFDFLRGYPATIGVLLTAVIIILAWEWRVAILALAVQYVLIGLLYVDVLDPRLMVGKVLTGLFVCLILVITAVQVNWGRLPVDVLPQEAEQIQTEKRLKLGPVSVPASWPLRLGAVLILALIVMVFVDQANVLPILTDVEPYFELAVYGLLGFGLLALVISPEPLLAGMGVLMFLSGFELFFSALEQSVVMLAALTAVNLLVAIVISYLMQRRYAVRAILD
jgi:hypothetical protein